jgi:hypothetical protein
MGIFWLQQARTDPEFPMCSMCALDAQTACPWIAQGEAAKMKLKIPAGAFHAYLFDCDGTIADSMPLHYVAWKSALAEWKCDFPEDLFYAWAVSRWPK